jgi:redox-sensitive bicupin YhaK (pirin superfamily)
MSAGTGIVHAERNPSKTDLLHLLQIWILPRTRGLRPRWEQRKFTAAERRGQLLLVVSGNGGSDCLRIDQDATIFISALDPGQAVTHPIAPGRRVYLFTISGALDVNRIGLAAGDQARIAEESSLCLTATAPTELILLHLP